MKLGETIAHNGIEAVLVEEEMNENGDFCPMCIFKDELCIPIGLYDKCVVGQGIFKQVESIKEEE